MVPSIKRPALAGTGGKDSERPGVYRASPSNATSPADWLNPRRRRCAERLLTYICWRGRKVLLFPDVLDDLRQYERLDAWAVRQAADDLYALGAVDIHLAGEVEVIEALTADLDAEAMTAAGHQRVVMSAPKVRRPA